MTVRVREVRRSGEYDNETAYLEYVASGTNDPIVAWLEVNAIAPPVYGGLVRDRINVAPVDADETVYECRVDYRKAKKWDRPETNSEEISFDIESTELHITHSYETTRSIGAAGQNPPNFGNGIEYRDGLFRGTTVMAPRLSFTITKYLPVAHVTNAVIAQWRAAAFHVNDSLWRNQPAGTCMFMGASGSRRNNDDFAIAFKFLAADHDTGLSVGAITGIDRDAWEHMWVLDAPTNDDNGDFLTRLPIAVYTERVYNEINFPTYLGLSA
jgi:hypothetical protein